MYISGVTFSLRYYGLKHKEQIEKYTYFYAYSRAKLLSLLPGKKGKFQKQYFDYVFKNYHNLDKHDNSIPQNKMFNLYFVTISDLIRREDIHKLQSGVKYLLKNRTSNRFLTASKGLEELCKKIDQMDSTLLCWYETTDCGIFEFQNHPLEKSIDYFTLKICNINSGYLSLQFNIYLSELKMKELNSLISCNYKDKRGFAVQSLTKKSNASGAYKNYSITHYNDNYLKADKIYEFISKIEWEFLQELSHYFPLVLHNKEILPPRIEVYRTDIDYHDNNEFFWESIGISAYQGQFIDKRHKMFFSNNRSGRYDATLSNNRLIYIFKDDDIEVGQLRSIKDHVYSHINEYANDYFLFKFLDILSIETGKVVIKYKHNLDKIKLKQNHLKGLLKLKYKLSIDIDDYKRYIRDEIWEAAQKRLGKIYTCNEQIAAKASSPFFISYTNFCSSSISNSNKLNNDIDIITQEFSDKKEILQNLYDYKSAANGIHLSIITVLISATTLFFVIFPEKTSFVADLIINFFTIILK